MAFLTACGGRELVVAPWNPPAVSKTIEANNPPEPAKNNNINPVKPAMNASPTPNTPPANIPLVNQEYITRAGDNIYSISIQFKISTDDIIKINNLKPPFDIATGSKILIPQQIIYVVERGDSLGSIAKKFQISRVQILNANNLSDPNLIKFGTKLIIPLGNNAVKPASPALTLNPGPVNEDTVTISPIIPVTTGNDKPEESPKSPIPPFLGELSPKSPFTNYNKQNISAPTGNLPARAGQFTLPVKGAIIQGFGQYEEGLWNDGINIRAKAGTPILAAENGEVAYNGDGIKGFGNLLLIRHADGFVTGYAHAQKLSVKLGERVKAGQVIGEVGQTGSVSEPQLHFEIRKNNTAVDPTIYLGTP